MKLKISTLFIALFITGGIQLNAKTIPVPLNGISPLKTQPTQGLLQKTLEFKRLKKTNESKNVLQKQEKDITFERSSQQEIPQPRLEDDIMFYRLVDSQA